MTPAYNPGNPSKLVNTEHQEESEGRSQRAGSKRIVAARHRHAPTTYRTDPRANQTSAHREKCHQVEDRERRVPAHPTSPTVLSKLQGRWVFCEDRPSGHSKSQCGHQRRCKSHQVHFNRPNARRSCAARSAPSHAAACSASIRIRAGHSSTNSCSQASHQGFGHSAPATRHARQEAPVDAGSARVSRQSHTGPVPL